MSHNMHDNTDNGDVFDPSFLALDWENLASLCSFLDPSTDASYSYDGARLSSVEGDDTSTSSHEWSTTALSRPELINQPYGSQGNSLAQKNYPGPAVIPICDFSRCPSSNPSPLRDSIQIPTQEEHFEHNYGAYATQNGLSIEESFPLPTQNHLDLRRALEAVLASPWKIQNAFEPRHDVLTAFLHSDADRKRWSCSFWAGGTPCTCSFSKKDQAKNHVRFHINHLPFSCRSKGTCPKDGTVCRRRFCSAEALQKHRGLKKECSGCGKYMLKTNIPRHLVTSCPQRRHIIHGN